MATGNILIVDDEDKMRHLLRRVISYEGAEEKHRRSGGAFR
jgi:DNA-binding response OmpR family regulator